MHGDKVGGRGRSINLMRAATFPAACFGSGVAVAVRMIVRTSIMATDQLVGMDPGVSRFRAIRMIPLDAATRAAETLVRAIQAVAEGAIVEAVVTAGEEVGAVVVTSRQCRWEIAESLELLSVRVHRS